MANALKVGQFVAFFFMFAGAVCQLVSIVTQYWLDGRASGAKGHTNAGDDVRRVLVGLHDETIEFGNGTVINQKSSLNILEEHYIFIAIAVLNILAALVLLARAVHVVVGVASFILLTLLFVGAFFIFERLFDKRKLLAEYNPEWPPLKMSWSFGLSAGGILLNIVATAVFLTLLLILGERKEEQSSKGLGPEDAHKIHSHKAKGKESKHGDRAPIVSVISNVNEGYEGNENGKDKIKHGNVGGNARPDDAEIVTERSKSDPSNPKSDLSDLNNGHENGAECVEMHSIGFEMTNQNGAAQEFLDENGFPEYINTEPQHTDMVTDLDFDFKNDDTGYDAIDINSQIEHKRDYDISVRL